MVTLIKRSTSKDKIILIPTEQIRLCDDFCRYDYNDAALLSLADSIQRHGMLTPITVKPCEDEYEVVSGRRRLRAAIILKLSHIPCLIADDALSNTELALIEDLQKQSLNIFEQANLVAKFIEEHSLTQEDAAKRLSCSQSAIANKLRILKLTDAEKRAVLAANLSERHARALLRITDTDKRISALKKVIADDMNVARCEALVENILGENRMRRKMCAVHDSAFFYNTIEQTVRRMQSIGMDVEYEKIEGDEFIEAIMRIRR